MQKITVKDDDVRGSDFEHSNMSASKFFDINLSGSQFHNINFSDVQFTAAQIGGSTFKHIGPPPAAREKQRPVTFEDATLCDSVFRRVDMSNVQIINCNIEGMRIDGVPVTELLDAYRTRNR